MVKARLGLADGSVPAAHETRDDVPKSEDDLDVIQHDAGS